MAGLLDVLDDAGRVVGQRPRTEVHRRGLLHRGVHVFVLDARGRLWLQKRDIARDLYPGLWTSSASGHVDAGEEEAGAVRREVREELGLDVEPRRVAEFRFRDEHEHELAGLWEATSDATPRPGPEVLGVLAVTRGELAELHGRMPWAFAPSFLAALRAYGWA